MTTVDPSLLAEYDRLAAEYATLAGGETETRVRFEVLKAMGGEHSAIELRDMGAAPVTAEHNLKNPRFPLAVAALLAFVRTESGRAAASMRESPLKKHAETIGLRNL